MCSLTEREDRKYGRGNKGEGKQETKEAGDRGDKGSVRIFATSMQIK
jgi:hypothetical protein